MVFLNYSMKTQKRLDSTVAKFSPHVRGQAGSSACMAFSIGFINDKCCVCIEVAT